MSSREYREGGDQEQEEGSDRGFGEDADLPDATADDWAPPQPPADQQGTQGDQQEKQGDQEAPEADRLAGGANSLGADSGYTTGDGEQAVERTDDDQSEAGPAAHDGTAGDADGDVSTGGQDTLDPPKQAGVDESRQQLSLDRAAREEQLREQDYELTELVSDKKHANKVYWADLANGDLAYFKPASGEHPKPRDSIPDGGQYRREVATYELDKALGFDLVPATVFRTDPDHGPGSLQAEAAGTYKKHHEYDPDDQMKMAVLDYVAGNTDRHDDNHLSHADGRPAAIDNGMAFPEDSSNAMKSTWVTDALGKDIDSETLAQVRAVDRDQLAESLRSCGLDDRAIDGALRRLEEVQEGSITGRAWGGRIIDGR